MAEKALSIPVQYVRSVYAQAHVRPYENRLPLQNEVHLWLDKEALPEAGHWRVQMEAEVACRNTDGLLCFETGVTLEAVAILTGLDDAESDLALRYNVASALAGQLRACLTSASLQTGYGPVMLPPFDAERIANLPSRASSLESDSA